MHHSWIIFEPVKMNLKYIYLFIYICTYMNINIINKYLCSSKYIIFAKPIYKESIKLKNNWHNKVWQSW